MVGLLTLLLCGLKPTLRNLLQTQLLVGDVQMRVAIFASGNLGKYLPKLGSLLLFLYLGAGCTPRNLHPPKITISGVKQHGEYRYGQVVTPRIDIVSPHPRAKVTTDIKMNDEPFVSGTPITEPGYYELCVSAEAKIGGYGERDVQWLEFYILLPTEIRLLKWSYHPHKTGYADVEAEFLVSSRYYPVKDIDFSALQLQFWTDSGTGSPQLNKVASDRMVILKNRQTQQVEAALIRFKTFAPPHNHVKAGKLLTAPPYQPIVRGEVFYKSPLSRSKWLARFKETVTLKAGEDYALFQEVKTKYTVVENLGSEWRGW